MASVSMVVVMPRNFAISAKSAKTESPFSIVTKVKKHSSSPRQTGNAK